MTGVPSEEEAAAVVAALEQMLHELMPVGTEHETPREPWLRAALIEGVGGGVGEDIREPWIKT